MSKLSDSYTLNTTQDAATDTMPSLRDDVLTPTFATLQRILSKPMLQPSLEEMGVIQDVGNGIARISGLPGVCMGEMVLESSGSRGIVLNLQPEHVGVGWISISPYLRAGNTVRRTGRLLDVPVGESLLGRIVDGTGEPLDGGHPIRTLHRLPLERKAPAIMQRSPVQTPLQTGIKVIDALFPIGRGQRELILGDRQTGKTAIALDTILHQHDQNVICIYCAIGQRSTSVARLIATLRDAGAMSYCVVVVASGDAPAGLQFITPYAATSMAEYFMERGRDVLIVYDDLTRHARAYRELSLLLRRPPAREAFPGDIFYIHSRLLERSTQLRNSLGGGSLTALPIIETEAQNLSAYIPTNLVSITDGQIYVSPDLFQKGVLPAVDIGRSVSRVGGKAQKRAYRAVVGTMRLAFAQFEELESFTRFGARLDETHRHAILRGQRIREIFKQPQYHTYSAAQQLILFVLVNSGMMDHLELSQIPEMEHRILSAASELLPNLKQQIDASQALDKSLLAQIESIGREVLKSKD